MFGEIKTRHGPSFKVASDSNNDLGRRFGILYTADEASQAAQRAKGGFIGETTGTGTWELPQPAVVVIDHERAVRFIKAAPPTTAATGTTPTMSAIAWPAIIWTWSRGFGTRGRTTP